MKIILSLFLLPLLACNGEDLVEPHLILIGGTGTGKSSLANVLLGEDPDCDNCTFPVCSGGDSCTKQTAYAVGEWIGKGARFTIVDTPGFGDSDNDDNELMNEMVEALKDVIKTANGFVLLFNGQSERFDTKAQQMIREMEALFGKGFWDYVILGVSFWHYDINSIMGRNNSGKTEAWWTEGMNSQLREKFHTNTNLSAVFIDSWAKKEWNLGDVNQQDAFERETTKLWDIFSNNSRFEFKTIQDIIDELNECELENACLTGEIQVELSRLASDLEEEKIKNTEQDTNLKEINIKNEEQDIKNEEQDAKNEEQDLAISAMSSLPLGTILSWVNRPTADSLHTEEIPDGWILCNGDVIAKGVWQGKNTPNLNGEGRFLRGGQPHEVLDLEEHMVEDHSHIDNGHSHTDAGHSHVYKEFYVDGHCGLDGCNGGPGLHSKTSETGHANIQTSTANHGGIASGNPGAETHPINMRVIWIMKAW